MFIRLISSPTLLRLYALLFLVTSGCAHTRPSCTTRCGVLVSGADCAVARRAEDRAVRALGSTVKTWTPGVVCEALRGWQLRVHKRTRADTACSATSWRLSPDTYLCVRGYTDDEAKTIWVLDGDLASNAYTHEVVHVVDVAVGGRAGHCDWVARGIVDAVYQATGNPDVPEEESDCAPRRLLKRIESVQKR